MQALELGIFDTTPVSDDGEPDVVASEFESHISDAVLAERLGYRYFFFIEHQNAGFPCISAPAVYLTALARATRTIRIGAMIFQIPLHHPIRLAQDAALIDHLSRGRLEFAVGFGTRTREFEPWKIGFKSRREMGQETLEIVRKAWTAPEVTHHGAFWTFENAKPQPRPYQRPSPPIWLGAHSPSSFDYAAAHNLNVGQIFEVESTASKKFAYFRAAWERHGHGGSPPRTLLVRHVHVAETDRMARERAEPYMLKGIQGRTGVERALSLRPEESTVETRELARVYLETSRSMSFWLEEGLGFVGSPQTVAAAIDAQRRRMGYDVLLLNHQFEDMPRDLYLKSMTLFGEQVIPALARAALLPAESA